MKTEVVAVVATFARPREVARLLSSLAGVRRIVICDNSGMSEIRELAESSSVPAEYIAPPQNLGCGGGLRVAEELAWKVAGDSMTHLLVLDDDTLLSTDTVQLLLSALDRENAVAAYPLIVAEDELVGWTPGLRDRRRHRLGENRLTVSAYRQQFGPGVAEFEWSQGICLLARRDAVERAGYHRADFWVRGEDLDFSLRLTTIGRGIFVPNAVAMHYPPPGPSGMIEREYFRHAAMIQNIAFVAFNQPHGRPIRRSLPGAMKRFVRMWGGRAIGDGTRAIWRGGVRGEPAGTGTGKTFKRQFDALAA